MMTKQKYGDNDHGTEQILNGGKETGTKEIKEKDGISYNERKIEKEEVAPNLLSASARFHMWAKTGCGRPDYKTQHEKETTAKQEKSRKSRRNEWKRTMYSEGQINRNGQQYPMLIHLNFLKTIHSITFWKNMS